MPSEPTTPVHIPKVVSAYSPTTQDPDMRSQINTVLLRDGHIAKIQETLLHSLNSSQTNWPTIIQNHVLTLLRSGEYTNFHALMGRVMEDIRADTEVSRSDGASSATPAGNPNPKGQGLKAIENGNGNGNGKGKGEGGQSLALPKNVVEEGLRITRECLDSVCDVVE